MPTSPTLESSLEDRFRLGVRRAGGMITKLAPTTKGMPDRLVLLPGGRMYLVELKTDTGRLAPAQLVWHDRAAALGTHVATLYGADQIEAWLTTVA